ncbi:hypothetical protein [Streptomyces sp. H34-S4]|uniref:hypothetical protein n=1 Tax=Streptomyces sp. H34-S4 TaxID=2996463 RepID=UPI00227100CE|nr:hypothetical protein [Streptomyces sp. H34-S4]MCY0933029.1 hypothetical protein [Streptomyces sp. H34-S4]
MMTSQADSRPVPDGIKTLVQSELNHLSSRVFEVLTHSVRNADDLKAWLGSQLCAVDQMRYQLETVQGILATYALAEDLDRSQVANWIDATPEELDWFTTGSWTAAQVAAARGEECPGENCEAREAYRGTKAILNRADYYASQVSFAANMLALNHVSRGDLDEHGWLADRTRKAITYGWSLQPKRTPATKTAHEAAQGDSSTPNDARSGIKAA